MSSDLPIVSVWAKTTPGWMKVGELRTWATLMVEPRHLQAGLWSLEMPYDAQALKVTTDRVLTVDFRGQRTTCLLDTFNPKSDDRGQPMLSIGGVDAYSLLGDVTCWPVPLNAIDNQTAEYYTSSGPAEEMLRALAYANMINRRNDDITFGPHGSRGGTISLSVRFDNLGEVFATKCAASNLGVRVGLVNTSGTRAQMKVEFYEPADRSQRVRLSHKVGSIRTWDQSTKLPTVTKAIIGGAGEGTARVMRVVTDAAAETMWGRSREVFIDARDSFDAPVLDERGTEALTDGAGQSSFTVEAAEAEGMKYGTHYQVGDKVTVELMTGTTAVDYLGAVRIECGNDTGVKVTPIVGNPNGGKPDFDLASVITGLRQRIRKLEQRR